MVAPMNGRVLTPEQIALAEARKMKKLLAPAQPQSPLFNAEKGKILDRPWISLSKDDSSKRIKVATWNMLAQTLVRRTLFPNSDCLKGSQRLDMTSVELLSRDADIMCLQEVDRLEKIVPILKKGGYNHVYSSGAAKKHGCLIAFKRDKYSVISHKTVFYDDEKVHFDGDVSSAYASSFKTRNIGLIAALESIGNGTSTVVATTHLFWHPRYHYERTRQVGILKREVHNFKNDLNLQEWPSLLCGDFNLTPNDAGYSLLVGAPLEASHNGDLEASRVIHSSLDANVGKDNTDDEDEGGNSDSMAIVNARPAISEDRLLSSKEFIELFGDEVYQSAYDLGIKQYRHNGGNYHTFGDRVVQQHGKKGFYEPEWTSFTFYWRNCLDYIFFSSPKKMSVVGILLPAKTEELEPGLPMSKICASDHLMLCADLAIS